MLSGYCKHLSLSSLCSHDPLRVKNLKLSSLLFGLRCSQICKIVLFVQIAKGLLLPEACTELDLKVTDTIQNPGPEYAGQINALWMRVII